MNTDTIINGLVDLRNKKGVSQRALAELTGLNYTTIAKIELGINAPRLENLLSLLEGLDTTPSEFFTEIEKNPPPNYLI